MRYPQGGGLDAEERAQLLGRVDPLAVKHTVTDEQAGERTHPSYYSLAEQWEHYVQAIQTLKTGEAFLRLPDDRVVKVHTPRLPPVHTSPAALTEVEEDYLTRLFRSGPGPPTRPDPDRKAVCTPAGPPPISRRSKDP